MTSESPRDPDDRLPAAGQRVESRETFNEVFRRFYTPLVRYARRITGDAASASDVVQDAFLTLWENRLELTIRVSLQAMLYVMVRNRAFKMNRRSKWTATDVTVEDAAESPERAAAPDEVLDAESLRHHLHHWIDVLPPRRREAFTLSRYHGLKHHEIAEIMDVSERTVDTHILLALRELRRRMDELQSKGISP